MRCKIRIISEFKDYYDVVQAQGQDPKLIWLRKPKEVELDYHNLPFPRLGVWQDYNNFKIFFDEYLIGFCGKLYPVVELDCLKDHSGKQLCYNMDEIDDFVKNHLKPKEFEQYRRNKGSWYKQRVTSRCWFAKWFEECSKKDCSSWFINEHCPVFVIRYEYKKAFITYNSSLRELEFFRVFDPYTAFQEISMYYGGVLGGIKEHVPDVPDKIMAEAKGFDKWSFRKESTK